jgi:N-acetylglutamate synthase-like GNAT family acetyltransferase
VTPDVKVVLRPFQPSDAQAICGFVPTYPVLCLTAEIDGKIAAYGGLQLYGSRHWVAFHLADERLRRPMWLHRIVARGLAAVVRSGISPIYALCDEGKPRSRAWLAALGFRPLREDEKDQDITMLERIEGHAVPHSAWVRS